jgi:hypothetical protein
MIEVARLFYTSLVLDRLFYTSLVLDRLFYNEFVSRSIILYEFDSRSIILYEFVSRSIILYEFGSRSFILYEFGSRSIILQRVCFSVCDALFLLFDGPEEIASICTDRSSQVLELLVLTRILWIVTRRDHTASGLRSSSTGSSVSTALISRSSSARRFVICLFTEAVMDFRVSCDTAGRLHFGMSSRHQCRLVVAAALPTFRCDACTHFVWDFASSSLVVAGSVLRHLCWSCFG